MPVSHCGGNRLTQSHQASGCLYSSDKTKSIQKDERPQGRISSTAFSKPGWAQRKIHMRRPFCFHRCNQLKVSYIKKSTVNLSPHRGASYRPTPIVMICQASESEPNPNTIKIKKYYSTNDHEAYLAGRRSRTYFRLMPGMHPHSLSVGPR